MKKRTTELALLAGGALACLGGRGAAAAESLPKPDPGFRGKVDVSRDNSQPAWPEGVNAAIQLDLFFGHFQRLAGEL